MTIRPGRNADQSASGTCGWCGAELAYSGKGRRPAYCSKAHRNRAWEVRTAQRRLERDLAIGTAVEQSAAPAPAARPRTVRDVRRAVKPEPLTAGMVNAEQPPSSVPATSAEPSTAREWVRVLQELIRQLADPGSQVRREHWHHRQVHRALDVAFDALCRAHPGGHEALTAATYRSDGRPR